MAHEDDKDKQAQEENAPRNFTITDRRGKEKDTPAEDTPAEDTPAEDTPAEDTPAQEPAPGSDPGPEAPPPPPITFATFILSLSSSALVQLGEIPDPFTEKTEKNLKAAQQTIDLLGLLEQKTQGNLNEDEKKALEAVLYDLRMRFLKASGRL